MACMPVRQRFVMTVAPLPDGELVRRSVIPDAKVTNRGSMRACAYLHPVSWTGLYHVRNSSSLERCLFRTGAFQNEPSLCVRKTHQIGFAPFLTSHRFLKVFPSLTRDHRRSVDIISPHNRSGSSAIHPVSVMHDRLFLGSTERT